MNKKKIPKKEQERGEIVDRRQRQTQTETERLTETEWERQILGELSGDLILYSICQPETIVDVSDETVYMIKENADEWEMGVVLSSTCRPWRISSKVKQCFPMTFCARPMNRLPRDDKTIVVMRIVVLISLLYFILGLPFGQRSDCGRWPVVPTHFEIFFSFPSHSKAKLLLLKPSYLLLGSS